MENSGDGIIWISKFRAWMKEVGLGYKGWGLEIIKKTNYYILISLKI